LDGLKIFRVAGLGPRLSRVVLDRSRRVTCTRAGCAPRQDATKVRACLARLPPEVDCRT